VRARQAWGTVQARPGYFGFARGVRLAALQALRTALRTALTILPRPAIDRVVKEELTGITVPVVSIQTVDEELTESPEAAVENPLEAPMDNSMEVTENALAYIGEVLPPPASERKPQVNSYATPLQTVVDDATIHIQADGTVRLFVSPPGVRILFDGPDVDAHAVQSVCSYILGTRVEGAIDIDALASAPNPNQAINDWYFAQPWDEQRKDRALRRGENLSIPITFLRGSQESLIHETELLLIALHPSITQSVRAVRYFGTQGDPPTISGGGSETLSLVRHLCHLVRLRNDFHAEQRSLPPDTFLFSKLKISFPEIAVATPDPDMATNEEKGDSHDLLRELLAQAKIIDDPSLYNDFLIHL
jgi:hypothetical protein